MFVGKGKTIHNFNQRKDKHFYLLEVKKNSLKI